MRSLRALRVLVLCALCVSAWSSFALDRHAFTFTDYDLTITLDPSVSGISARGSVVLRNDTAEPQKMAVLQVSSTLDWKSITVEGKAVQFVSQPYTSDLDHTGALSEAIVTLPAPVPPQGTVRIEVAYAGAIAQDSSRLTRIGVPAAIATRSDFDRIAAAYGIVRGVGHVAWYPIATEAQSLAEGSTVFREIGAWEQREVSSTMRVAVAGAIGGAKSNGAPASACGSAAAACFVWQPLGWSVPVVMYGAYQELARSGSQVDYLPGQEPLAEDYSRAVTALLPFIREWFGEPTRPLRIVEIAWPDSTAWESGPMLLTPLRQTSAESLQMQLVHQLAHAALPSSRQWIFEGAAQFAQVLQRERQGGRRAAVELMEAQSKPLLAAQQPVLPDAPGRSDNAAPRRLEPLVTTSDELFYRLKAMRVWWMLHDMLGDAPLQRALHNYKAQDDREPSYMQRLIEAETLRKLEWFFDDWVYRDRGLPDFRVESVYPRAIVAGGYTLTITVENTGDAGAEVPVLAQTAHGDVGRRLEVRAHSKGVIRIEVPEAPRRVVANDGSVPEVDRENNWFDVKLPAK